MKKSILIFFLVMSAVSLSSCAFLTETAKVIWGSSTRALEKARVNALTRTFQCSYDDCFDRVLSLSCSPADSAKEKAQEDDAWEGEGAAQEGKRRQFDAFIKNKAKGLIVVIGIPGSIETTEVGIFFSVVDENAVKVEVSSLSTPAKQKAADLIFTELALYYSEVK
ncbi:MAG: hypothetical protein WC552_08060 [Candidatus Omnitrophota bacterium]